MFLFNPMIRKIKNEKKCIDSHIKIDKFRFSGW